MALWAAAPIFRALIRRPVIATIHGTEMVYKNPLYVKTVIPALRHLNAVVTISRATDEKVHEKLPGIPTQIIHWGAKDDFYLSEDREQIRRSLGDALGIRLTDRPVIMLAGRMTERKGAHWFVEHVMPSLLRELPDIVCLIAGQGKDYDETDETVKRLGLSDSVHLLGYVLGEQRKQLYNAADLFVMPNREGYGFEGFGMVAIEATSCGTPAVVGAFAGTVDAVLDGKTGWLVPVDDVPAYVQRITAELKMPSLRRADVRRETLQAYDWHKAAQGYLKLFSDTIESARKR